MTVRCSGHIINCVVPHRCTKHKLRPIATYVASLVSLSVSPSVCLSLCLSVCPSVRSRLNVCGSRANGGAASRRTTVTAVVVLVIAVVLCNKAPVSATRVEQSAGFTAQLTNVSPQSAETLVTDFCSSAADREFQIIHHNTRRNPLHPAHLRTHPAEWLACWTQAQ